MTRAGLAIVALALASQAAAETRVVASQATVTATFQSQPVQVVSNTVVAKVQEAAGARREAPRQLPETDTDKGSARGPGRVPGAKRTR